MLLDLVLDFVDELEQGVLVLEEAAQRVVDAGLFHLPARGQSERFD